jgi:hypothetical protein
VILAGRAEAVMHAIKANMVVKAEDLILDVKVSN